ncbi:MULTISPECIES: WYL domain-containing protein [Kitasatospora]|uniref:Putative DeoR family transcriptional regulator n=1 Tax=Kitasatospora setae (strain ATCC 33774 / DSM 43861 / JCM 3304 / KCC A-0304 / NBRC 14216 / KM-6054) TaxID=452652 RepID=E4N607_KITSK|nr:MULTISPECIES: WYL domain-containing protein [Kitasatospora]BAJ26638.1 putative DeoR family transcriptional regulator [Kitasatospora setae KM-6054]
MRAARLIRMALLLQSSPGRTAAELGRELGVSERTVIRDVQALQEAGIPVRSERGRAGGYRLAPGHRTRLTTLDPTEAETLYLSGLPTALRDLGLSDAADTARLKLSATLLPSLRAAAESSARRFHLDAPAWFREPSTPELLPELARALWADRAVELAYARPGREPGPAREVEPYGLVLKAGVWYLVARVPDAAAYRTYRADRISALRTPPGEPFSRDAAFELAAYWQEHSARFARTLLRATVTLRLTPEGARRLPEVTDRTAAEAALAASSPEPGGRTVLELAVESEEIAFAELVRLGAEAEVLAPPALRARFARHARDLAALYPEEDADENPGGRVPDGRAPDGRTPGGAQR